MSGPVILREMGTGVTGPFEMKCRFCNQRKVASKARNGGRYGLCATCWKNREARAFCNVPGRGRRKGGRRGPKKGYRQGTHYMEQKPPKLWPVHATPHRPGTLEKKIGRAHV